LLEQKRYTEVDAEIQEAIKLLPRDYFVWLELGRARDFAGNDAEALAAFYKAASLAPAYADVSWQLGNTLLRSGKSAEGFAELRKAATRNSGLWLSLIDLAASLSSNTQKSEDFLKPDTNEAYLAFATYYATHKMPTEALRLFGQAKMVSDIEQTELLKLLFTAKHYNAAYKIWLLGEGKQFADERLIVNRDFESPLNPEEKWFGWNTVKTPNVLVVKTDFETPKSGASSLRVDFTGEVPTGKRNQL
jgi:tetratricopeptide (TPR) repeat protein